MPPILPLGRGDEPQHHGVHKASGNKKKEAKQVVVIIASTFAHPRSGTWGLRRWHWERQERLGSGFAAHTDGRILL